MRLAVLDHGMGNLRSVAKAFEAVGASVIVTADPGDLDRVDALCVPGQGIFRRCIDNLIERGQRDHVVDWITGGRPFFGICLGMQILFESSEEQGPTEGLGLLGGRVERLTGKVTVPHIGWNTISTVGESSDAAGYFYFDHSYAVHAADDSIVKAWCDHGVRFAAWVESGSVVGVQFHPEKSGGRGLSLLQRWVSSS